jgi:hypothetical protein
LLISHTNFQEPVFNKLCLGILSAMPRLAHHGSPVTIRSQRFALNNSPFCGFGANVNWRRKANRGSPTLSVYIFCYSINCFPLLIVLCLKNSLAKLIWKVLASGYIKTH